MYDRIDIAICCNERSSDWDVHDYIIASNGKIIDVLMEGMREQIRRNQQVGHEEFDLYQNEINFLM